MQQQAKPNKSLKEFLYVLIILIFIIAVSFSISTCGNDQKKETTKIKSETQKNESEGETPEQFTNRIKSYINELDSFNSKNHDGSIQKLEAEIIQMNVLYGISKNIEVTTDSETVKLLNTLNKKVINWQQKEFPNLRKKYSKLAADAVWEENIKIKCNGNKNEILIITGAILADNKQKKKLHEMMGPTAKMFRFKKVIYKWFSYDDDPGVFEIDSKPDTAQIDI